MKRHRNIQGFRGVCYVMLTKLCDLVTKYHCVEISIRVPNVDFFLAYSCHLTSSDSNEPNHA